MFKSSSDKKNLLRRAAGWKPSFLITIDTEGDNCWESEGEPETRNARFLPRFQSLCEAHGLSPTYLTNYEMMQDEFYREFAADCLRRGKAEIGMHLHAWNNPPLIPLTSDDRKFKPYLMEYPEPVMIEKIRTITRILEDFFQVKMRSHRSGRWAFNSPYAKMLASEGYDVDCSVVPGFSWKHHPGKPDGPGGSDYRKFPRREYFLNLDDISRPGISRLLEIPVSSYDRNAFIKRVFLAGFPDRIRERVMHRLGPGLIILRPDGRNLTGLLEIVENAVIKGHSCLEFMIHSSELMPGGSIYFRTEPEVEKLYEDLEALFSRVSSDFTGMTLSEHYDRLVADGSAVSKAV